MGDKKGNGGFALLCCFISLGVAAVITFIAYLLPLISSDITVGGDVMNILDLVCKIVSLIGLAFGAFAFAGRRGAFVKALTAIFVLVFAAAIVLVIVGIV